VKTASLSILPVAGVYEKFGVARWVLIESVSGSEEHWRRSWYEWLPCLLVAGKERVELKIRCAVDCKPRWKIGRYSDVSVVQVETISPFFEFCVWLWVGRGYLGLRGEIRDGGLKGLGDKRESRGAGGEEVVMLSVDGRLLFFVDFLL
jgi:hypothetical protein